MLVNWDPPPTETLAKESPLIAWSELAPVRVTPAVEIVAVERVTVPPLARYSVPGVASGAATLRLLAVSTSTSPAIASPAVKSAVTPSAVDKIPTV